MDDQELLMYSKEYVYNLAKSKPYNIQCRALKKYLEDKFMQEFEDYLLSYDDFCKKHVRMCVRDLVYKKDYYTPRDMYLLSPEHYVYYNYYVFKFFFKCINNNRRTVVNFSKDNIDIFYSGNISFENGSSVKENSTFNSSYRLFQDEKAKFVGYRVLKIDIQDFFKNISIDVLIDKMKKFCQKNLGSTGQKECNSIIENLNDFYIKNNFNELPQLHYSVASSALSQFYLMDFSNELSDLLIKESLKNDEFRAVRFVDDMYIKIPKGKKIKSVNNMVNIVTTLLWKENLNLNTNKLKIMLANEYKKEYELLEESIVNEEYNKKRFLTESKISNKIDELLKNNAQTLQEFFRELAENEKKNGVNIDKYHKLINDYIAIDGDHATKVINGLIFSGKWKRVNLNILNVILNEWKVLIFNPAQFTIFFILLDKHLSSVNKLGTKKKLSKKLIYSLKRQKRYTIRDGIIAVQYLMQMGKIEDKLLLKIFKYNKEYIYYLKKYVI